MNRTPVGNFFRPLLVAVLTVVGSPAAEAQWRPSGVPLCDGCGSNSFYVEPDGQGGAFVGWREGRHYPSTGTDVYAQRITREGYIAPGWPARGLGLCTVQRDQNTQDMTLDGKGGVVITWSDQRGSNDIYAQRVTGAGTIPTGWPDNGSLACDAPNSQSSAAVAADGSGGAFIVWNDDRDLAEDVYLQHLDSTGLVSQGWPVNGIAIATGSNDQLFPDAVDDGTGGVVVIWAESDNATGSIHGVRITGAGMIATPWDGTKVLMTGRGIPSLAKSGDGFYVVGASPGPFGGPGALWIQRFTMDGEVYSGWPSEGLLVCGAPDERDGIRVEPDGLGGALLTWWDYRNGIDAYATRVLPEGVVAPGWTPDGKLLNDPGGTWISSSPEIASDGMGGAYVVWHQENPDFRIHIQHLTAQGQVHPGWPTYGARVSASDTQFNPKVVTDGEGGAIAVWEEAGTNPPFGLYAQRFRADGVVSTQVSLLRAETSPGLAKLEWAGGANPQAAVDRRGEKEAGWTEQSKVTSDASGLFVYEDRSVANGDRYAYRLRWRDGSGEHTTPETWVTIPLPNVLALEGLRPNPASRDLNVAFSLTGEAPARIELIDIAGRAVIRHEISTARAGHQALRIGDASQVAPGVYWIRLTQGQDQRLARGVIVR